MAEINEDDREMIRVTELYRYEIRQQLEQAGMKADTPDRFWAEKLLAPGLLILVTALASGFVVPYILRADEDQHRAVDLKFKLEGDMVADAAAKQIAFARYNDQLCDYWLTILTLAKNKQNALKLTDAAERKERTSDIAAALKRETELRTEADKQIAAAESTFAVSLHRLSSGINLYFGEPEALKRYLSAVNSDSLNADTLLNNTHQDRLLAIYNKTAISLKSCQESECEVVIRNASDEIEEVRKDKPAFAAWQQAERELSIFIIDHDPRLVRRSVFRTMLRCD
jgi:hypothetical protein